jgi:hypothetical protein
LIEREQLNEIQWFELVNAGWKKKSSETNTGTTVPAPSLNEGQNDEDATEGENGDVEGSKAGSSGGSQSAMMASGRTRGLRKSSGSPSVVRLVDRFNIASLFVLFVICLFSFHCIDDHACSDCFFF